MNMRPPGQPLSLSPHCPCPPAPSRTWPSPSANSTFTKTLRPGRLHLERTAQQASRIPNFADNAIPFDAPSLPLRRRQIPACPLRLRANPTSHEMPCLSPAPGAPEIQDTYYIVTFPSWPLDAQHCPAVLHFMHASIRPSIRPSIHPTHI